MAGSVMAKVRLQKIKFRLYLSGSLTHFYLNLGQPMVWEELKLREEDDYTVDMDISHCGICGSDIHTMNR